MINEFGSNLLISLSVMYGGSIMFSKSFVFLLQLPVSEDGNEEKSSPYQAAATGLIWSTITVGGVFG